MRRFGVLIVAMVLGGCATQPASVAPAQQAPTYQPSCSAALAFDPPVTSGMVRLDLSRDDRGPAAFAGFDQGSTTYYYLGTDDWYSDFAGGGRFGSPDNYQRRAVSQTFGITYR